MGRKKDLNAVYLRLANLSSPERTVDELVELSGVSPGYVRSCVSRYALPFKRKGHSADPELRDIVINNIRKAASSVKTIRMLAFEVGEDLNYVTYIVHRHHLPHLNLRQLPKAYAELYYRIMGTAPDSERP